MKEVKDDINRWRHILCSWIGIINTVKMTLLPQAIYRFNVIPIKLPTAFFTELGQKNCTICMETQKTTNRQSNLEKEKQSQRNQAPGLQKVYKATVIKTVWYWHKNRNIDQWNTIESPETNLRTYGHLSFDKGCKNGEKTASSISGAGKTGQLHVKE